jgi:acetoacetyl-CoA synthetase
MGVATYAFNGNGQAVYDEVGELVCTQPIPSMPLYFWGDKDGKRYQESYFETWPGVWLHGDWLKMIPRKEMVSGVVFGRSDSTINRYGLRMGTSDKRIRDAIKTQVSARFVPDEIAVIAEVPRTISAKKLEVPIKKILLGQPVETSVNRDSMGNPDSIDWFVEYAAKRRARS